MTDDGEADKIVAEITALRRDIAALKARSWQAHPLHSVLKIIWRDLETDPFLQYQVHRWGSYYWLFNFFACSALFFFSPGVWLKWGLYITLMYSIYANLATDYGSMSAAMAAFGGTGLPPIPAMPVITVVNGNGHEPGADGGPGGDDGAGADAGDTG